MSQPDAYLGLNWLAIPNLPCFQFDCSIVSPYIEDSLNEYYYLAFLAVLGLADFPGAADFAGATFFVFNLAALPFLPLARFSAKPLSSAIFFLASEKFLAVRD